MNFLTAQTTILLAFLPFISGAAHAQYRGGGSDSSTGNTNYELIPDVELRSHSTRLQHPYEVIIPDTQFGELVICQLFDSEGEVIATRHENTGNRETRVFFEIKEPAVSALCAYIEVELWIDS